MAQGGATPLAKKLKIDRTTIYDWLSCESSPTAMRMKEIVKLAKGAVTYEDIILETTKGRK
jgi:DNA-binding phage protein